MARRYLTYLLAACLASSCMYPLQHTERDILNIKPIPRKVTSKKQRKFAKIYWDAYADEEWRAYKKKCKPKKPCPKENPNWKPDLEKLINNVEADIVKQVKESKRFQRYYENLDFILTKIGKWKSDSSDDVEDFIAEFVKDKPIKFNSVDLRLAFSGVKISGILGYAHEIPGSYLIVREDKDKRDTTIHELGHLFGLYHNDVKDDQMHHVDIYKNPKFAKDARVLIVDRIMSMIRARGLETRIDSNKPWLESVSRSLDKIINPARFSKVKGYMCTIEHEIKFKKINNDYTKMQYIIAINPSGSLHVEYFYRGDNREKNSKKEVERYKDFFKYLQKLGIDTKNEEAVFYETNWVKRWRHVIINIEAKAFQKNFDEIISYLDKNGFFKDKKKVQALETINSASFSNGLNLFDLLYYYAEKRK